MTEQFKPGTPALPSGPQVYAAQGPVKVQVENINMPFWALVGLLLKVAFAAVPAIIILAIVNVFVMGLIAAMMMR